jgi:hypothetical protein
LKDFERNNVADDDLVVVVKCAEPSDGLGVGVAKVGDPDLAIDNDHGVGGGNVPDRIASRSPSQPIPAISAIACFCSCRRTIRFNTSLARH